MNSNLDSVNKTSLNNTLRYLGISKTRFAELVGVSREAMTLIANDKRLPDIRTAQKIVRVLNDVYHIQTSIDELWPLK
ncbi:helix-turn-helix domain-containing protein [Alicyclobacillaceae bacterium I2511]|nr:helix-turn-helix domain-containing protein [Alicyclobacillaceae bacterium I2511]